MHVFFQKEFCYESVYSPVPVKLSSSLSEQSIRTVLDQLTKTKTNQIITSDLQMESKAEELSFVKFSSYKNSFDGSEYINESRLSNNQSPPELKIGDLMWETSKRHSMCADMDCKQCGYEKQESVFSAEDSGSYFYAEEHERK